MREYVVLRPKSDSDDWDAKATDYLARIVHESEELIEIGILDHAGNKVMARAKMSPIGFVRHK